MHLLTPRSAELASTAKSVFYWQNTSTSAPNAERKFKLASRLADKL